MPQTPRPMKKNGPPPPLPHQVIIINQWEGGHRWELPGNYPVFNVVMVIYHYVERIWRILIAPDFCITFMTMNKYYSCEPVNIHIQPFINIMQENNRVITTKKG